MNDSHRYDDIINLPHHVSKTHPRMPCSERAAQFSPFAALTGYADAVAETARLTEEKPELSESRKAELDAVLQILLERIAERPEAVVTYFRPDGRKSGGARVTEKVRVRAIDPVRRALVTADRRELPLDDITDVLLPE